MLRKIKLHGELAEFLGQDEFEAVVRTTAEAVKFLITNFPKLEAYMSNRYYQVLVGDNELDKDHIHDPVGKSEIHFVPVISGAGGSSMNRILLGGALIGASFLFPGAGLFGTQSFGGVFAAGTTVPSIGAVTTGVAGSAFMTGIGTALSAIGAGMVLNGVSEILFPLDTGEPEDDPRISFNFSGVQNTSRAGTSHPICYGEIVCGSVVISASVDTNQVVA
jgi:predicted phage tail protein|tara:strand:+ start:6566 stop:7225 length:660 start_codon:yes stop_codon:yes gene_type:complete